MSITCACVNFFHCQVGLRKKLWQKLSPLRLGYLAWTKADLAGYLGHLGLHVSGFLNSSISVSTVYVVRHPTVYHMRHY